VSGDALLRNPIRHRGLLRARRERPRRSAAERELRAIALGRRNWTFAGSDEGGRRAAAIYTLIATAKLNDVDPQTWLADVLARLPDHPAKRIHDLLPWNWRPSTRIADAA
jgi:transposase